MAGVSKAIGGPASVGVQLFAGSLIGQMEELGTLNGCGFFCLCIHDLGGIAN